MEDKAEQIYIDFLKRFNEDEDDKPLNLLDSIKRTQKTIKNSYDDSKPAHMSLQDSYGNSITGIGSDDKIAGFQHYTFDNNSLNWTLWLSLYNDSWVFRRAIDKPAQDEVNVGISLKLNNAEDKQRVLRELRKYKTDCINLLQWGALFGGSIAVMIIDGVPFEEMSKPLDTSKLNEKTIMRLYVTDRWYGVSPSDKTITKMNDLDFGKPESYRIMFADGKEYNIDHTYVIRYEHRDAPKFIKNGPLQGWGYAEGAHIINELARDDQLKSSVQSLINKSLIEVIKMAGMRGVFMGADSDNERQLQKRLEMVNWGRNYNSLTFLDKDDEYDMNSFSGISGLSDLLEQNMWLISAALEMQGILFGDLKNGFSTDTNAMERYDETIQNRCNMLYRPALTKLLTFIYKKLKIQEDVEFEFESLFKKQKSKDDMEAMKNYADLISTLLSNGILTPQLAAKSIQNFANNGIIDFGLDDEAIKELDDRVNEEMEDIDLDKLSLETSEEELKNPDDKQVKINKNRI